jgi:hypothetical protein
MATPALGMIEGGTVVHYMVHAALTRCGGWDASRQAVASVPPGCRMCKRCTRRDGLSLECGCDEMLGEGDATFGARYSEDTGYLWTDEELNVGGHDLLGELESHEGRYCLLEIRYSHEVPGA